MAANIYFKNATSWSMGLIQSPPKSPQKDCHQLLWTLAEVLIDLIFRQSFPYNAGHGASDLHVQEGWPFLSDIAFDHEILSYDSTLAYQLYAQS